VRLVTRLAVDVAVEHDDRVDGEDRVALDRRALAGRVLAGERDRLAGLELLDAGDDDLEGDPELLEDRPALRAPAG
jgi:hypothetical protein